MSNPAIAQLIAQRLPAGLPHPGDPANHQQPSVIRLPGFNTTGMSPEQAEEFVGTLAQQFGESIVNLIETDGYRIVSRESLAQAFIGFIANSDSWQITTPEQLNEAILDLIDGKVGV